MVWSRSENLCKEYVKKLSLPPGRLTGPIVLRCQLVILDNAFAISRASSQECVDLFKDLEDWKRRNDFNLTIESPSEH